MSEEESKVDLSGAWNRTRDGRKAGVYAIDCGGVYPVHGWITSQDGSRRPVAWTENGRHIAHKDQPLDLIRERKAFRLERWVNVYHCGSVGVYDTRAHANLNCTPTRIACVKVIIEGHEGDGLEP